MKHLRNIVYHTTERKRDFYDITRQTDILFIAHAFTFYDKN